MRRRVVANDILIAEVARLVAEGECVTLLTKGNSMLPFIVGGRDSVELCRVDGDISVGDILLAQVGTPSRYVIHRVLSVDNKVITLMGDGNILGVERCTMDGVLARVRTIITPQGNIDVTSKRSMRRAHLWRQLLPLRRGLLFIYKRLFIR